MTPILDHLKRDGFPALTMYGNTAIAFRDSTDVVGRLAYPGEVAKDEFAGARIDDHHHSDPHIERPVHLAVGHIADSLE